ncbi:MAG: alpha/beta fold hydrolase [Chloroflexi bacterium]|nr:alpha/beta fold hydrolase [Chloroflexota bacterium]
MTTFVLVHGAWHGGWCWWKMRPLLEAKGHSVFTPTLTGLGERSHLLTTDVNLTTHIQDVAASILYEELDDVILVGHSYGGLVISGVVQHISERLRHVVYLDAIVPKNGETEVGEDRDSGLRRSAIAQGDGWKIPVPPISNGSLMGVTDPDDLERMIKRLTPHPLATFQEASRLDSTPPYPIPGTYVLCTGQGRETSGFIVHAERAKGLGWGIEEIPTGHDLMITEPQQTADLLMQAAEA